MFNCYNHGWSSLVSACPICFPIVFRYSSSTEIKLDQDTESTSEASNLQTESVSPDMAKTLDTCDFITSGNYQMNNRLQERIAELESENERLKNAFSLLSKENDGYVEERSDLEARLKLATDALEYIATKCVRYPGYDYAQDEAIETLAKLKESEGADA